MSRKYTVRINYTVAAELAVRATSPMAALKLANRIFADESTADQFRTTERSLHALETTVGGRQHYLFPGMRKTISKGTTHGKIPA